MRQLGLIAAVLLPFAASASAGESNCKTKSSPCIDAKTGETLVCTTTTCYDDKGKEISTVTVVTMQGDTGGATGPGKPKAGVNSKLPEAPVLQSR